MATEGPPSITATPSPAGLRPTIRQLMILVLGVAAFLAPLFGLLKAGLLGNRTEDVCLAVALLVATCPGPLLMALLAALDRRGPTRGWYIRRVMAAGSALAGVSMLTVDPICRALTGRTTIVFPMLPVVGVICLWGFAAEWRSTRPGRCPSCGRMSVIAVATRFRPPRVRVDDGWCARCGEVYAREGSGPWTSRGPSHVRRN